MIGAIGKVGSKVAPKLGGATKGLKSFFGSSSGKAAAGGGLLGGGLGFGSSSLLNFGQGVGQETGQGVSTAVKLGGAVLVLFLLTEFNDG